jgi:peptidyl-prolyl cis-trans isomerase-like protein 2
MVKRQKEKQYQSSIEHKLHSQFRGGRSSNTNQSRPLPFDCCALTLTPFTSPVCCIIPSSSSSSSSDQANINLSHSNSYNHGIMFENSEIIPYIMKHHRNPIDGTNMSTQSLITLNMDKEEDDADGANVFKMKEKQYSWKCPILDKPFMNHTKIVAIRIPPGNTANVYSYEAFQTLNLKPKNYIDLISGTKFHPKKDVIILNDLNDDTLLKLRDINNFTHLRNNNVTEGNTSSGSGSGNSNINLSISAKRIMEKFQSNKEEKEQIELKKKQEEEKKQKYDNNGIANDAKHDYKKMKILTSDLGTSYTKGQMSGSFTSTSLSSSVGDDTREATQEEILSSLFAQMKKLKRKAFVRMFTNLGDMDIELHCDIAPRTCMNFIGLIQNEWYNGKHFHRLIKNFMVQGGGSHTKSKKKNSSKSEKEDQSIWGHPFEDEFDPRLKHTGPGVISMANAGSNQNNCQFFITFKSATHLDNKHSVFGKVVKGLNVLSQIENIPTDKSNYPLEEIYIQKMVLFGGNPVREAEELEEKRIRKRIEEREKMSIQRKESALGHSKEMNVSHSTSHKIDSLHNSVDSTAPKVGRYLQQMKVKKTNKKRNRSDDDEMDVFDINKTNTIPSRLPPPPKRTSFGDFSGW